MGKVAAIIGLIFLAVFGAGALVFGGSSDDNDGRPCVEVLGEIQENRQEIRATEHPDSTEELNEEFDRLLEEGSSCEREENTVTSDDLIADAPGEQPDGDAVAAEEDGSVEDELALALDELEDELTIRQSDLMHPEVREVAECVSDVFLYNSLTGVALGDPAKRQYTDAVTIPYQAVEVEGMMAETRAETCQNVVFWDMVIRGLAQDTLVVNGKTLRALNPWIDGCQELAGDNQDRFADPDSVLRVEETDGERELFVRSEVQVCAMYVNALLSKAQVVGIVPNLPTSENWHLPGVTEGAIPRVALNANQYTGHFMVLDFTAKGFGCVQRIGFNTGTPDNPLGDKRFARFSCEVPIPGVTDTTVPPTPEVPVSTTPSTTPGTTPPTVPPTTTPGGPCVPGEGEVVDPNDPNNCIHISITDPDPCERYPWIDVCQPVQENNPAHVAPTPGAPAQPHTPPAGPAPVEGTPPSDPLEGGYNSGSPSGSGSSGGSLCDAAGNCTGGGSAPAQPGTPPVVEQNTTVITAAPVAEPL